MTFSDREFEVLLRCHLDGIATDEQFRQLNEALKEDPERVADYVSQIDTETLLEWELGLTGVSLPVAGLQSDKSHRRGSQGKVGKALAAAACVALSFVVGMQFGSAPEDTVPARAEAVLFDSEDAVWKGNSDTWTFGTPFRKGKSYELESGVARLAFANGAGLAIEGPSRMKVVSADRVEILEGRIAAYVPDEAVGFVVAAPGMNIVDLGTKFGAAIKADGSSEVHVFEGQVEIEQAGNPGKRLIEAGEGLLYESGSPTSIPAKEEEFAEPPSLEQLLSIGIGERSAEKKFDRSSLANLAKNPDLILFEDFAIPPGEIDGQRGALGFGDHRWMASQKHTQIVKDVEVDSGGRLLVRGRQGAEPNMLNRLSIEMENPLPNDFYLLLSGRYDGFDDDDFFGIWVDSMQRQDSSHSYAPNLGIREGRFFARIGLEDTAIGPSASDGETFTLLMKVERHVETGTATVKLWHEDFTGEPVSEVTAPCRWMEKEFRFLGIRMGIATDITDKLIVSRLAVGTTLDAVLSQP